VSRIELAKLQDLQEGETKLISVDGEPPYRSIVLVKSKEQFRAYWNVCQHIAIPLDGGLGRLPLIGGYLVCSTHGAKYEVTEGICVKGPCTGSKLPSIELEMTDDTIFAVT